MTDPDKSSTNKADGYSVDALKKYIGISKPQYEYRRNAIDSDRVPNTRFSDGDLITYRIVSRLVDRCRIPLAWLAKHDWKPIFEACNYSAEKSLRKYSLVFHVPDRQIFLIGPNDKLPIVEDPFDLAIANFNMIIDEHYSALAKGYKKNRIRSMSDELVLNRIQKKINSKLAV